MKLVITENIEQDLNKLGMSIDQVIMFLKKTPQGSNKLIELCSPLPDTIVYKAYLGPLHRGIFFVVVTKGLIYPVYVGDKGDKIGNNITKQVVAKYVLAWQEIFLMNINRKLFKIRHF
ncbi:MAG TPA: hypothetical protein PKD96_00745 [Candidatus Absconditabacterales bacterium]|nr:hypothetical protein [Candidatus Absconditabacterales bacterium]HMT26808.1 hypothetical protein [Candidatus Absconditabacterales bacterium]